MMPYGLQVVDSGTKAFTWSFLKPPGLLHNSLIRYSMSPGYDLTTVAKDADEYAVASNGNYGWTFSPDGTKLLTVGGTGSTIVEHSLSTPYDLATAAATGTTVVISYTGITSLRWEKAGMSLVVAGTSSGLKIAEMTGTVTPYDLTGMALTSNVYSYAGITSLLGVRFANSGRLLYIGDINAGRIRRYYLSTPYLFSTMSTTYRLSPALTGLRGFDMNANASKLYVLIDGTATDGIKQYSMP